MRSTTLAVLLVLLSPNAFAIFLSPERELAPTTTERFVATNDGYVAFWSEGDETKAARIALDGSIVARRSLFRGHFVNGAAFDGNSIVVVTQRFLGTPSPIEAFRITADLSTVGAAVPLGSGLGAQIAADHGHFIAGWLITPDVFGATLVLSRLDASLAIVRQRVLDLVPQPHVGAYVLAPGDGGALVVWNEELSTGFPGVVGTRVRAVRVTDDLTIADPGGISIAPRGTYIGNAWWEGAEWLVVWVGDRSVSLSRIAPSGAVAPPEVLLQPQGRFYYIAHAIPLGDRIIAGAQYVGPAGDPFGFALNEASLNFAPSEPVNLVAGADGRVLLSYHRYPTVAAFIRIVDLNAERGRQRPIR